MSDLLDASVLVELSRRKPDPRVVRWLESTAEESLHLSVITLGELRRAAEGQKSAARREKLRSFLDRELPDRFADRLLGVDAAVAQRWGRLLAQVRGPLPGVESLLAATALAHGLRVVARDVRTFRYPGLEVFSPWES
jgi:predicted nucleic acid-binding protein